MPYLKRIVCLANSFRTGGFCVAGREITSWGFGAWIRPVSDRPKSELSLRECVCTDGTVPRLLDIVDFVLLKPCPHAHQQENHLNDPSVRWIKRGVLAFDELGFLSENVRTLWTNSDRTSTGALNCISVAEASAHMSSLMLVRAPDFQLSTHAKEDGYLGYRGSFSVGDLHYRLNVTDPCIARAYNLLPPDHYAFREFEEIFLTISLTQPYDVDHRCHKLIAAVFTNPPQ